MRYVLFIASKVGYFALCTLIDLGCELDYVFIEQEHAHEHEKFYIQSLQICRERGIATALDANSKQQAAVIEALNGGLGIDYIMCFGCRKMIQKKLLDQARIAALGTHFSPLPRYRGFAPLNWLLINGESETAVNLFFLEDAVDSGDIIDREPVAITLDDDINTLYEKCLLAFKVMLSRAFINLETASFDRSPQDEERATFTCARNPEDGEIDWHWPAKRVYDFIRAQTYPYPGAYTYFKGQKLIIWRASICKALNFEGRIPGKVIQLMPEKGIVVLCGEGAVLLEAVHWGEFVPQSSAALDLTPIDISQQVLQCPVQSADRVVQSIRVTLG